MEENESPRANAVLFELHGPCGLKWRLRLDGSFEGFPESTRVVNFALPLVQSLINSAGPRQAQTNAPSALEQTHSSNEASPGHPSCQSSMCPRCDDSNPSMRPQTLSERILTIHQAIQRNRQLGLPAPTWSDLDVMVGALIPVKSKT